MSNLQRSGQERLAGLGERNSAVSWVPEDRVRQGGGHRLQVPTQASISPDANLRRTRWRVPAVLSKAVAILIVTLTRTLSWRLIRS